MNSLIYFIPQAVILPEIVIVIGAAMLSHAMTTQISKIHIRLSALYIPMLIAGLMLLKMPPTLNEENAIKNLFIHIFSMAAVITVPGVIVLTVVHFAGGKKPTRDFT